MSLKKLGLTPDEAKVYLVLLDEPMTHLEIARKSGVNRTKVYRVADVLIKRSLITEVTNDQGRMLSVTNPLNLEISLTTAEEKLNKQKDILKGTLPALQQLFSKNGEADDSDFIVNTYEGISGFKQMLWNELSTKGEILIFGHGTIQDLVSSEKWAEKHRSRSVEAGYKIRELLNPFTKPKNFSKNREFYEKIYEERFISHKILPLGHQMCIYNNTVAIYNWRNDQKVGTEIINKSFADMQRVVFENFWKLAK